MEPLGFDNGGGPLARTFFELRSQERQKGFGGYPVTYTRTAVAVAAVLSIAVGLAAQDKPAAKPADVAGTWDLSVSSPNGTGSRVLKMRQDGEKLTGEIESSMSSGKVAGSVTGNAIAFTATVGMETGTFEIRYTGKVDADKMSGDVDFGDYGRGTWSGVRRK
jgi:hypothetical protein